MKTSRVPRLTARFLAISSLCLLARGASAQSSRGYEIRVTGACPTATQVKAALDFVVGAPRSDGAHDGDRSLLEVTDAGPRYQVSLTAASPDPQHSQSVVQRREYTDPARSCEERARVAAVFAVVTVEPPELVVQQLPRAIAAPPRPPLRIAVGLSPLLELAPGQSQTILAYGGELRAMVSGNWLGLSGGLSATAPADAEWGGARASLARIPFDAGIRAAVRRGRFELSGEAGVVLALLRIKGESLPVNGKGTRLDVGFRAAAALRLMTGRRWSPVLGIHTALMPRPYTIVVAPRGDAGSTPMLWVGGTLGIAAELQ